MKQEKMKQLEQVTVIVFVLIVWLIFLYIPPKCLAENCWFSTIFYGIGQLIIIVGFIAFLIFFAWQKHVIDLKKIEITKANQEFEFRKEILEKQMGDADKRRKQEQLMRYDIAIARMLEAAIIKNEDVSEPVWQTDESGGKGTKVPSKKTNSRNEVDTEAFKIALENYNRLNPV